MSQRVTYLVFDNAGNPLGEWPDAPVPSFRAGIDGLDALSLTLPRAYGALDEPGEAGSDGTVAHGNRVEVWVSNSTTADTEIEYALVEFAAVGEATVEQSGGPGTLVWSGTAETVTPTPPVGVQITCLPLSRILAQSPIIGTFAESGDPLVLARRLVQVYCPGLTWDSRNPVSSGEWVSDFSVANLMAVDALAKLRDLCGPDWLLYVTRHGTVRLFLPDTEGETADHELTLGAEVTDAQLVKETKDRAKFVIVVYGSGGDTAGAAATDYTGYDPRAVFIQAGHLTEYADAERLAQLTLQARNRVTPRGTCTVHAARYPIETIEVGQTVRLHVEQPAGNVSLGLVEYAVVGEAAVEGTGANDYDRPLVVAGIDYGLDTARLELTKPQPHISRALGAMARRPSAA